MSCVGPHGPRETVYVVPLEIQAVLPVIGAELQNLLLGVFLHAFPLQVLHQFSDCLVANRTHSLQTASEKAERELLVLGL